MTPSPNLPAGTEFLPPELAQRVIDWVWHHNNGEGLMCREKPNGEWSPCQIAICFDKYDHVALTGTIAAATTPLPQPRCDCGTDLGYGDEGYSHSPSCSIHRRYRHILPGELAKMPTKPEGLIWRVSKPWCDENNGRSEWSECPLIWPYNAPSEDGRLFVFALPPQPEKGKGGEEIERQIWSELEPTEGGETCAPSSTDSAPATTCSPVTSTQTAHSTGASNAEESTSNPSLHPPTPPISLPVRAEEGTPRTDAETLSLLCKSLTILAKDRGESGDKTVEQDISFPVEVLQNLGKELAAFKRLHKEMQECEISLRTQAAALSRELEESREGRADFIKLLASTLGVETDRQDYIVMHIQNLRAELEEAKAEVARLIPLAYETRPGLDIPSVTWAEHSQEVLRKLYAVTDELTALRAAPSSETEGRDKARWKPIETAPRPEIPGKIVSHRILAYHDSWDMAVIVKWSPQRPAPHWTTDAGAVLNVEPTHWMPLPERPAIALDEKGAGE